MSKTPLSIESLLERQRAEKEAAAKVLISLSLYPTCCLLKALTQPKFLSREERAKLAIQKRAGEIRDQKEKEEKQRQDRETLEREAESLRSREQTRDGGSRYGRNNRRQ